MSTHDPKLLLPGLPQFVAVSMPSTRGGPAHQKIFCCYIPVATKNERENTKSMEISLRNIMQHIAEHNDSASKEKDKIKTVALPLLGTGRYGHTPSRASRDILDEFMRQLPHSGVQRVQFLDQRVEPLEALKSALADRASKEGASCELAELPIQELIEPGW